VWKPGENIEELSMPLVGVAELARLLKRDPKAIRFAVSRGRITRRSDGLFDVDQAIAEWQANTLHERSHSANKVHEMAPANDLPLENERPAKGSDYTKDRAGVQIFEARLKKLRYEEKAKNLVPARDVADATYRIVSCIRETCLNIPARVAAQLAIKSDQARCYAIVEAEVIAVFTDFAEGRIT
jgi:hypothetical protein